MSSSLWNYEGTVPKPYGDEQSYRLAAKFLSGLTVEDWGCGYGWFRGLHDGPYTGVDGAGGHCDVVADLRFYRSQVEGVLLRHVLEHNPDWRLVLEGAVASFTKRLCVVLFTPNTGREEVLRVNRRGIPDLALDRGEVASFFDGLKHTVQHLRSATEYGVETVYRVSR